MLINACQNFINLLYLYSKRNKFVCKLIKIYVMLKKSDNLIRSKIKILKCRKNIETFGETFKVRRKKICVLQ